MFSYRPLVFNTASIKNKIFFLIICLYIFGPHTVYSKTSDLSGKWYSSSDKILGPEIRSYIENGSSEISYDELVGIISPHAGLRFSGPVAGYAYNVVRENNPELVILIGFSHKKCIPGKIAVLKDNSFITPVGEIFINREFTAKLLNTNKDIIEFPEVFSNENSIELQIPFIQVAAPKAELVLIILGDQKRGTCDMLSDILYRQLKNKKKFLLIASSDMSHQLPYDLAKKQDNTTINILKTFDYGKFYNQSSKDSANRRMCGYGSVYTLLRTASLLGGDKIDILKYLTSGDTSGDNKNVVGYLSAAVIKSKEYATSHKIEITSGKEGNMINDEHKKYLLEVSRNAIRNFLTKGRRDSINTEKDIFKEKMGAFVTLHKNGRLRGCIGNIVGTRPLIETIVDMSIASATEDPRFPSLKISELKDVDIEISILTPLEKITDYNDIELGKHGVLVKNGWQSGVYLPQVATETGWDLNEFMNSLCRDKAGMKKDAWKTGACEIFIFEAIVFGEDDFKKL